MPHAVSGVYRAKSSNRAVEPERLHARRSPRAARGRGGTSAPGTAPKNCIPPHSPRHPPDPLMLCLPSPTQHESPSRPSAFPRRLQARARQPSAWARAAPGRPLRLSWLEAGASAHGAETATADTKTPPSAGLLVGARPGIGGVDKDTVWAMTRRQPVSGVQLAPPDG